MSDSTPIRARYPRGEDYIVTPDGCWEWQKAVDSTGYGRLSYRNGAGRPMVSVAAHRWYYERANGPIPGGMEIDHLCRNKACVNPAHLEVVSRSENVRRGIHVRRSMGWARRIRKLHASGMSQKEIASVMGVDTGTICHVVHDHIWREDGSVPVYAWATAKTFGDGENRPSVEMRGHPL